MPTSTPDPLVRRGFSRSLSSTYQRVRLRRSHLREASGGLRSFLAGELPGEIALAGLEVRPASNLPFVFFISGVLRLIVSLGLLTRIIHERFCYQSDTGG